MQEQKKASIRLSLHQEIEREVQQIEEDMAKHPELDQIQVTEEMDKALLEKIRAYEKEKEENRKFAKEAGEDLRELQDGLAIDAEADGYVETGKKDGRDALRVSGESGKFGGSKNEVEFSDELVPDLGEIMARERGNGRGLAEEDAKGKVVYRRKKRKYWIVSLAAVFVIVLGVGMNSVGSKSYWKMLKERFVGEEPVNVVNVEDMEEQNTEDVDELDAYREIKEKLNFTPVRLIYKPDEMELKNYEIFEEMLTVQLLYKYKEGVVRYILYVNSADSSWGEKRRTLRSMNMQFW